MKKFGNLLSFLNAISAKYHYVDTKASIGIDRYVVFTAPVSW